MSIYTKGPNILTKGGWFTGIVIAIALTALAVVQGEPNAQPVFAEGDIVHFAADPKLKGVVGTVNCTSHRDYCTYRVVFSPRVGKYPLDSQWLGAHMIVKED